MELGGTLRQKAALGVVGEIEMVVERQAPAEVLRPRQRHVQNAMLFLRASEPGGECRLMGRCESHPYPVPLATLRLVHG